MQKTLPILPKERENVNDLERVISLLGGCYLLYDALRKDKKSLLQAGAGAYMVYRGVSGYCPATDTGKRLFGKPAQPAASNINIHVRMIVQRPVNEVYSFWRHLGNLPLFMEHLQGVTVLGDTLSEWTVSLPGNLGTLTWKSEIVADEKDRMIGWRSLPGSSIRNYGRITFKNAGELGTLVHAVISYEAPLGIAGEHVANLFNPIFEKMVRKDVLGFKRYMETGTPSRLQQENTPVYI